VELRSAVDLESAWASLRLQLGAKFADKHKRFEQTGTEKRLQIHLGSPTSRCMSGTRSRRRGTRRTNPFTSPHEDDILAGRLTSDKGAVRALAYDIVLNGTELGSGSIRIHRQDVQAEIFPVTRHER